MFTLTALSSSSHRSTSQARNATSSGEHKFKLTALFLNQLGGKDMFGGWTAKNALFSKEEAAKREAKEAAKVA